MATLFTRLVISRTTECNMKRRLRGATMLQLSGFSKKRETSPPGRGRNALIAEKLNAEGVQTFQGGRPWTADNVKKVLQRLRAKR